MLKPAARLLWYYIIIYCRSFLTFESKLSKFNSDTTLRVVTSVTKIAILPSEYLTPFYVCTQGGLPYVCMYMSRIMLRNPKNRTCYFSLVMLKIYLNSFSQLMQGGFKPISDK